MGKGRNEKTSIKQFYKSETCKQNMQTKNKNVIFKLNINIIHARKMLELYNIILFYVKRILINLQSMQSKLQYL